MALSGRISAVVPVYNSEDTIEACIGSIMRQTYSDVEIVAVDDGSTDNSGAVIDRLALGDRRLHVVHQPNKGRTEARRIGVEKATGEWITFVDSDDTLPPDALDRLAKGAAAERDIVLGNGYALNGETRESIPIDEFRHMAVRAEGTIGVPWGCLYRHTAMTRRLFDMPRHIMMGEDYIFWLRLTFATEKPVGIVYDKVYNKGEEHTSNSFRWTAEYAQQIDELRRDAIPAQQHREFMSDMVSDRLANMLGVAQWTERGEWLHSAFYRKLLADMSDCGQTMPPRARIFLATPSLKLRRLMVRISTRKTERQKESKK